MSTNQRMKDEQFNQLKNISDTLIEATNHFVTYLKKREFSQSIHIFSSIVEGYEAIKTSLSLYENDLEEAKDLLTKLEKNLIFIANQLEQKDLLKVTEVIQFSLMPNFKKLNEVLSSQSVTNSTITIGIYFDRVNPREIYPESRINALIKEGERQGCRLILFTSEDIDLTSKKVSGDIFKNNSWERITTDFPDVVHNVGVYPKHQQSIIERKLRRLIPFTSYGVGNKFYLPKIMVKHRRFAELLVPFKMVTEESIVYDYLENEEIAVLKPILGARGESIYFVRKKGNRFVISEHRQEKIFNRENFNQWIREKLISRKFSYMIQRYVECKTADGEPFDIRAHMQKDKAGQWTITRIYPRIGSKQSILSNISRGGRTEDLKPFLVEEFGKMTGEENDKKLRELSIDLAEYLDRIHNFSLDELGLDLAIDNNNRFWLHEANNGPQSTYHETERAVNTIGYAKYIAKNGIVKQNQLTMDKEQFHAKESKLPFAEVDERYRIGMLKSKDEDDRLAVACAYVANYENVQFYTFAPEDVDYNEMLIKASFYDGGEWVNKIVEYPDVIYDRFRLRGIKRFNDVYEELKGIPFTNEFFGNSISKLEVYDKLKATGELEDVLIPYKKVEKVRDIFDFIEEYEAVIVKPEIGSFARGVHYISRVDHNTFFVAEREKETEFTEIELRKYFNELLEKGVFIVQKYIKSKTIDGHPFDIRVHMMRDGNNEWDFVSVYPRIGLTYATIMAMNIGGYTGKIDGFLKRNYPDRQNKQIVNRLNTISEKVTSIFSSLHEESFNEIAFDFALDENAQICLIELNINKPGITTFEFDLALRAIPNALYIAKQTDE